jgi:dolichol-phosphate mannosyltransferase
MKNRPHLYIIIPILNEAGNLPRLFRSLHAIRVESETRYDVQFIMVDDGSTDDSAGLALSLSEGLDLIILRHEVNQGPGAAFGTAFEHLARLLNAEDWVLTIEGDNTSRLNLINQMMHRTQEGYDSILASPYMYGGGILNTSPLRTFLSSMSNTFVKEFLQIHGILTVSSFFRLYRGDVIHRLQAHYGERILEQTGFECMVEMLIKMIQIDTTISEIPMVLDTQLRVGKSNMKIIRTILGYFACALKMGRWRAEKSPVGFPLGS